MAIDTSNNGLKPGNTGPGRAQGNPAGDVKSRAPEAGAGRETAAPQEDSVVLSNEAQTLGRLRDSIDAAPEVDSEKVANLRQAIAEGRFEINADRLADAMLSQDDLLG